jgi:hypothetical protein
LTNAVVALTPVNRMTAAVCAAVGVSRATVERRRSRLAAPPAIVRPRQASARALTAPQHRMVLDLLHAPRFADQAPAEIYATLLDEGVYHCSIRTMYRILGQNGEVRERRQQLRHPVYQKPELLAEKPNQVWSWDITPEVSAGLSQTLRLHRGRQKLLPCLLRLVQPRPPPLRDRPDDPGPGALRPDRHRACGPPAHPQPSVRSQPRALRQKAAHSARQTNRHMDQSADTEKAHLNAGPGSFEVIEPFSCLPPSWHRNWHRQSPPPCTQWVASTAFRYVTLYGPTHDDAPILKRPGPTTRPAYLAEPNAAEQRRSTELNLTESDYLARFLPAHEGASLR